MLGQHSQGHALRSPSYAIVEGRGDVVFLGAATTMEHEEEGLPGTPRCVCDRAGPNG